ncbi:MAG TPA: hypothetical protein GXX70_06910 [Tepidimicrobium sp.]|nr:hypothetical protein [Tepidimicrobium sp.]
MICFTSRSITIEGEMALGFLKVAFMVKINIEELNSGNLELDSVQIRGI